MTDSMEFPDSMRPMEFIVHEIPREVRHEAHRAISLEAGKALKLEIDNVEILNEKVPIGKQWELNIGIDIIEKDVM